MKCRLTSCHERRTILKRRERKRKEKREEILQSSSSANTAAQKKDRRDGKRPLRTAEKGKRKETLRNFEAKTREERTRTRSRIVKKHQSVCQSLFEYFTSSATLDVCGEASENRERERERTRRRRKGRIS